MSAAQDFFADLQSKNAAASQAAAQVQADLDKLSSDQKAAAAASQAAADASAALVAVVTFVGSGMVKNADGTISVLEVSGGKLREFTPPDLATVQVQVTKNDDGTFTASAPAPAPAGN